MYQNPAPQKLDYGYAIRIGLYIAVLGFVMIVVGLPIITVLQIGVVLVTFVLVLPKLISLVQQTQKSHKRVYRILALVIGLLVGGVSIIITGKQIMVSIGLIGLSLGLIGIGLGLEE